MNKEWFELNKKMQQQLKKSTFDDGIKALLELRQTLMKEMMSWKNSLEKNDYSAIPFINADGYHSKTVAYSLWHIFRIEDIVVHTLIKNDNQVFFEENYQRRMNAPIITTGNELSGMEIAEFSKALDILELFNYVTSVDSSTNNWLRSIDYTELIRKFSTEDKQRIKELNVVANDEEAEWLIDYWCNKDIKGLIKMPLSRHWLMHIEAALRIINKVRERMSKYEPLWNWIKENGTDNFQLTYAEIENIIGLSMDHSFLTYKKELLEYGYKVGKISMKKQTVAFEKVVNA